MAKILDSEVFETHFKILDNKRNLKPELKRAFLKTLVLDTLSYEYLYTKTRDRNGEEFTEAWATVSSQEAIEEMERNKKDGKYLVLASFQEYKNGLKVVLLKAHSSRQDKGKVTILATEQFHASS